MMMLERFDLSNEPEAWSEAVPETLPEVAPDTHAQPASRAEQPVLVATPRLDVPTLLLAIGLYGAFAALTWFYHDLAWWLVLPLGAAIVCLQSSLQHEAIHGYPTRFAWLNYLIAAPALWLWLPYGVNREGHLRHHVNAHLTDPDLDPESNYVLPEHWARMSPAHRTLRQAMATLLGRIVIGPVYYAALSLRDLARALRRRDRAVLKQWALHALVLTGLGWWVVGVCDISVAEYLLLFVWPGTGLALIRSFAEHRAAPDVAARSATVEAGRIMSFLYLYNNLHALHHAQPTLAWHRRARRYRVMRNKILGESRYHLIKGYGALFRDYLLDAKEPIVHPAKARDELRAARVATPAVEASATGFCAAA
jgi:fatty acid desaturase